MPVRCLNYTGMTRNGHSQAGHPQAINRISTTIDKSGHIFAQLF